MRTNVRVSISMPVVIFSVRDKVYSRSFFFLLVYICDTARNLYSVSLWENYTNICVISVWTKPNTSYIVFVRIYVCVHVRTKEDREKRIGHTKRIFIPLSTEFSSRFTLSLVLRFILFGNITLSINDKT